MLVLTPRSFPRLRSPFSQEAGCDGGFNSEAARQVGLTPLMCAAQAGSVEACELLIAVGASINAQDEDGMNPLHFAALSGSEAACRFLVSSGACTTTRDDEGRYPIDALPRGTIETLADRERWESILNARSEQ